MKIRIKYNAPVILTFALLSGVILLADSFTGMFLTRHIFRTGPDSLLNPVTYLSMFVYVLGHASWEHYLSNMSMFLLLGPGIEEKYGSRNTLYIILITAFVTAVIQRLVSDAYLLGASGIVFAFIVLSSMTSSSHGEIPLTMILVMVYYLGTELFTGLTAVDNVSQLCHLAGGLSGAICGWYLNKNRRLASGM